MSVSSSLVHPVGVEVYLGAEVLVLRLRPPVVERSCQGSWGHQWLAWSGTGWSQVLRSASRFFSVVGTSAYRVSLVPGLDTFAEQRGEDDRRDGERLLEVPHVLQQPDDLAEIALREVVLLLHPVREALGVGVLKIVLLVVDDDLPAVGQDEIGDDVDVAVVRVPDAHAPVLLSRTLSFTGCSSACMRRAAAGDRSSGRRSTPSPRSAGSGSRRRTRGCRPG